MKQSDLENLFEEHKTNELVWEGNCHDCKQPVTVSARVVDGGFEISGGAVYQPDPKEEDFFLKCSSCYDADSTLKHYRETAVYSRVVGYYSAKSNMNKGKQAECKCRVDYRLPEEV